MFGYSFVFRSLAQAFFQTYFPLKIPLSSNEICQC